MTETAKKIPIGVSDFKEVREEGYYYIDKTGMIREITDSGAKVLLLPRPRRFGKTLNMSMLRYFFEKSDEDRGGLFEGAEIYGTETFRKYQGKYPVIWLTFKDLKEETWENTLEGLKHIVRDEFFRHGYLLESDFLSAEEKEYFQSVIRKKASFREYTDSLRYLSSFLARHHGEPAVILIDEYDTPLQAAWIEGYYKKMINFIRTFLGGGLKDNSFLFKGVLTGILRVAKESVFSDLNNLKVHTLLHKPFADAFGFTEAEVKKLLGDFGIAEHEKTVARWYNGYLFGGYPIYNPWSVLNYVDDGPETPFPYWNNTATTEMIERLVTRGGKELKEEIGLLLEGNAIKKPVFESIVMKDLDIRDDLLWSFLLFSGYLKSEGHVREDVYLLNIPNR